MVTVTITFEIVNKKWLIRAGYFWGIDECYTELHVFALTAILRLNINKTYNIHAAFFDFGSLIRSAYSVGRILEPYRARTGLKEQALNGSMINHSTQTGGSPLLATKMRKKRKESLFLRLLRLFAANNSSHFEQILPPPATLCSFRSPAGWH